MSDFVTIYRVYEVSPEHRKHGKVIRDYKTLKGALNCVNKSIYRFYLEKEVLMYTIRL
jgi:hypothetical protein